MLINDIVLASLKTPVRTVEGRAEVYNNSGSTAYILRSDSFLKEFKVERIGDNTKFFGYGFIHKANIKARDINRAITLTTANTVLPYYIDRTTGEPVEIKPYPKMNITEVNRDENTNELSITCYDNLYKATAHKVEELELTAPYTLKQVVETCASFLGLTGVVLVNVAESDFSLSYENGANLEGTETIRDVLDMAAEATQTIYYIDKDNKLTFKRLDINGEAVLDIQKADYITLDSKTNRRLATLVSATELGDSFTVSTTAAGSTQYIRNNAFWDLREDRTTLLENALAAVGGLTINQFECSWRGNYLLEIGDKISLETKDNEKVYSYILNDIISYNGALSEATEWKYEDNEEETEANPTTIGDAIKYTYAKVDKANKQIDIVASEASANKEALAAISANTESISLSVEELKKNTEGTLDTLGEDVAEIKSKVETVVTADAVKIAIKEEIANGVDKVTTATGFTFDNEGLTVSKSDSEIKTQITEDGMSVYKEEEEVLTANNEGVKAANLHATTYLIIGNYSRFEDYTNTEGEARTGCFWIGD